MEQVKKVLKTKLKNNDINLVDKILSYLDKCKSCGKIINYYVNCTYCSNKYCCEDCYFDDDFCEVFLYERAN